MLALDAGTDDGRHPLRELCAEIESDGLSTALLPTPINWLMPELAAEMAARQPRLVEARHVAVLVAAPDAQGGRRDAVLAAAESLARRWAQPDIERYLPAPSLARS